MLSREEGKAERNYDELYVRSETGLGAEAGGDGAGIRPRSKKEAAPALTTQIHP